MWWISSPLSVHPASVEESGVLVDVSTAACVATTPWPMPQSLMVGYFVRACDSDSDSDSDCDSDCDYDCFLMNSDAMYLIRDVGMNLEYILCSICPQVG